jgi:hypothetical protein
MDQGVFVELNLMLVEVAALHYLVYSKDSIVKLLFFLFSSSFLHMVEQMTHFRKKQFMGCLAEVNFSPFGLLLMSCECLLFFGQILI